MGSGDVVWGGSEGVDLEALLRRRLLRRWSSGQVVRATANGDHRYTFPIVERIQ